MSYELASLPTSIREYVEQNRGLARTEESSSHESVSREMARELAKSSPEMAALLLASNAGYREIAVTQSETSRSMQPVQTKLLGFTVYEEVVPVTTSRTVTRSIRLNY